MVYFCYYIFIYSYYLILFFFDCFLFLSFFSSFLLSFGLFFFQSTFSPTSLEVVTHSVPLAITQRNLNVYLIYQNPAPVHHLTMSVLPWLYILVVSYFSLILKDIIFVFYIVSVCLIYSHIHYFPCWIIVLYLRLSIWCFRWP